MRTSVLPVPRRGRAAERAPVSARARHFGDAISCKYTYTQLRFEEHMPASARRKELGYED